MPSRSLSYVATTTCIAVTFGSIAQAQAVPQGLNPSDLKAGVVVVNSGHFPESTSRELAHAIYTSDKLKPRNIDDSTARVLIGQPVRSPSDKLQSFAEYRKALGTDDAATRTLLTTICAEVGTSAGLLVYSAGPQAPRAKLFIVSKHNFYPIDLWPRPNAEGKASWTAAVNWLEASATETHPQTLPASQTSSILGSPWLWGAVGAATAVGLVFYASSRDDSSNSIHLQGRVAP